MEDLFGFGVQHILIILGILVGLILFTKWVEAGKRRAEARRNRRG